MIKIRDLKHLTNNELQAVSKHYKALWEDLLYSESNSVIVNLRWNLRNIYVACDNALESRKVND